MKLAFSLNAYVEHDLSDAVEQVARLGYDGVELMADVPHLYPADVTEDLLDSVSTQLRQLGLGISNINAFTMHKVGDTWHPSWVEPDEAQRRDRLAHTIEALRVAAKLGSPSITTEPGGPLPDGVSREQAMEWFVEGLESALAVAEEVGVDLLVEPEPDLLVENADQYLELRERIDSSAMSLNFDIGHFYCVGVDPMEALAKLRPHLRHVHLEDIAASREHFHLIPGDGVIALKDVLGGLKAGGYDGWVAVELYPYTDRPTEVAEIALDRVRKILEEI